MKRVLLSALFISAAMSMNAQSPLKLPALSPGERISQDFSVSSIDISYSRPSMRGRKIFGDVVQYGRVWRTGANAPTKIKIGEELEIDGQKVRAGEYALYTIPGRDRWEVILNTGTGTWTAEGYPTSDDVARFSIKPITMERVVQTFTIGIADITYNTCKIELEWDRTKIVIPVVAHNAENIEVNIDKAINHPAQPPYFQVANYYYESEKKLDLAKIYVDKALENDPKAFYGWYLKARIEKKLGHPDEAIAAAKKSMETAKGNANEAEYIHNNQKLIDEINRERPRRQKLED